MSASSTAENQHQTSETPQEADAAQVPTQAVQPSPQAETQTEQAPIQAEGDLVIDDSTSAYSDDL